MRYTVTAIESTRLILFLFYVLLVLLLVYFCQALL
jgi:hypothetical protein